MPSEHEPEAEQPPTATATNTGTIAAANYFVSLAAPQVQEVVAAAVVNPFATLAEHELADEEQCQTQQHQLTHKFMNTYTLSHTAASTHTQMNSIPHTHNPQSNQM